jgi:hypothetical protein
MTTVKEEPTKELEVSVEYGLLLDEATRARDRTELLSERLVPFTHPRSENPQELEEKSLVQFAEDLRKIRGVIEGTNEILEHLLSHLEI